MVGPGVWICILGQGNGLYVAGVEDGLGCYCKLMPSGIVHRILSDICTGCRACRH